MPPAAPFTVLDDLNRQFREGRPSSRIEEAGVLVAILDGDETRARPWERPPSRRDHFSATIVNAQHPDCYWHMWSPGFVIRSETGQQRLRCSYPQDVGSVGCPSGCCGRRFSRARLKEMMEEQNKRTPFGPRHCQPKDVGGLDDRHCGASTWGYNELILNNTRSNPWEHDVPAAIQAIFVQVKSSDSMIAYAQRFHRSFVATFRLHNYVPLLQYNWEHPTEPFSLFGP